MRIGDVHKQQASRFHEIITKQNNKIANIDKVHLEALRRKYLVIEEGKRDLRHERQAHKNTKMQLTKCRERLSTQYRSRAFGAHDGW